MTKNEIIAALEGLKDYVNDGGKAQIEGIKTGVRGLPDPEAPRLTHPEPHHKEAAH